MRALLRKLFNFCKREDGPTAVEYAVMLALIIVACISAISVLGDNGKKTYKRVGTVIGNTNNNGVGDGIGGGRYQ